MLKKTITYDDLDGNPVTEDFYFNLSKAEIAEMEISQHGGFAKYVEELIEAQDGARIIAIFKDIISKSIGRRSEDNRRFLKSEEIAQDFLQSDAYSVLFMELVTGEDSAAEFMKAIIPQDMVKKLMSAPTKNSDSPAEDEVPAYVREDREPTQAELQKMSKEELQKAFAYKFVRDHNVTNPEKSDSE
jgi:hypothetical protein